jgi:D-alanyl-D-alanine carboxypeptidase
MLRFAAALVAISFAVALPAAASTTEPAYILVDADSGAVLAEGRANQPWYPASVTKLMTAYLVFEALASGQLKATSPVVVSKNASAEAPSKMGYKPGTVLNVENALKMMMVKSANDIAVALAETVGGSESKFVALMNEKARRLGMASTHFNNPNGLPDNGQITTARDLAVLARAILADFPEQRQLFQIPAIKAGKKILRSQNKLLEQFRGATGMKTGFICASGFNMVASAERNGKHLIAVVLGAGSGDERTEVAARLLTRGFGSWMTAGKPRLEALYAAPAQGEPVNLREIVCSANKPGGEVEEGEDPTLAKFGRDSGLVPRFVLMDPVPVFTGRADTGAAATKVAGAVPMPNLRPRGPAALPEAASAFAAEPAPSASVNVQDSVAPLPLMPDSGDPFAIRFDPSN